MTASDGQRIAALAAELTDVRRRGVTAVDRWAGENPPLELPELEQLAAAYAAAVPGLPQARATRFRYLLTDAVLAWQSERPDEATLVRNLFIGPATDKQEEDPALVRDLPLAHPDTLYERERRRRKSKEHKFDRDRREAIRLFADFLIDFVAQSAAGARGTATVDNEIAEAVAPQLNVNDQPRAAQAAPAPPTAAPSPKEPPKPPAAAPSEPFHSVPRRGGWRTWSPLVRSGTALGVLLLAAVIFFVVRQTLLQPDHATGSRSGTGSSPGSTAGASSASHDALFTFDALGGGNPLIRTFRSPTVNSEVTGRYPSGESEPVRCKTTGELASPNTAVNEHGTASDIWLQIDITGAPQYARLTYGRIDQRALDRLPRCLSVS